MRNIKKLCVSLLFILFHFQVSANEEVLDYFYVEDVYVNHISRSQIKKIDPIYKYVVAFAFNTKGDWRKARVGIFLHSKKSGVEILDMFPPSEKKKLIPVILKGSPNELIVGVYNEFSEIKKIKYSVNLEAKSKLVSREELKYDEIPSESNIKRAITLANNNKYVSALRILAPCLNVNPAEINQNVEDCLYNGEEISDKAFRHYLLPHFEKNKTKLTQAFGNYRIWFSTLGIKVASIKYAGTIYTHNYLKVLKKLFPNSKYQDVFDYVLLERGVNNIKNVQKWVDSLIAYRSKYPEGRYIFNATADLANAYDNLWELLTPDAKYGYSPYYHEFTSGNKKIDINNADKYRTKALKLYKTLENYPVPEGKLNENILLDAKSRLFMLKERVRSNSFYILND